MKSGTLFSARSSAMHERSDHPHFLSEADCHEIAERLVRFARGGGSTTVRIESRWTGNVRWARNLVSTSGEVRDNQIQVSRSINGAEASVWINDTTDRALVVAARRAERLTDRIQESLGGDGREPSPPMGRTLPIFSETTYQLDADHRAAAAQQLAHSSIEAGMLSAGYIEVAARSTAFIHSAGQAKYCQWTEAQYSVTVRDPKGVGSGWAGVDWYDWAKIDGPKLSAIALDKCIKSRNPVAIEPGRYTTILEPQAVGDFIYPLVSGGYGSFSAFDRLDNAEEAIGGPGPFNKTRPVPGGTGPGFSKLGEKVIDERITIGVDPMDPELGYPPSFDDVDRPVTWIEHGVLTNLAYHRQWGVKQMGLNTGMVNPFAFRMSGGDTSIDEMIITTKRGLLVTRFWEPWLLDVRSALYRGCTRDGLWLIENGKISKAAKNMIFTESILFALNNVEQLGVPQRVFHPTTDEWDYPQPVVVPPIKVKDFSFTALSDAI